VIEPHLNGTYDDGDDPNDEPESVEEVLEHSVAARVGVDDGYARRAGAARVRHAHVQVGQRAVGAAALELEGNFDLK
jgi:hypothetical protein